MASPLASVPGLSGYLAQTEINNDQANQGLQQAQAYMTLQQHFDQLEQDQHLRRLLADSGGDVEKAMQAAVSSGNLSAAQALSPVYKIVEAKKTADEQTALMNRALAVPTSAPDSVDASGGGSTPPSTQPAPQGQGAVAPAVSAAPQPADWRPAAIARLRAIETAAAAHPSVVQAIESRITAIQGQQQKPLINNDFPIGKDMVQPHISFDGGHTWQPLPGSKPAHKFASTVSAEGGGLDKDALGVGAWDLLLFRKYPPGFGSAAAAQKAALLKERARIGHAMGLSDMEIAMLPEDNKVKMKAIGTLTNWGSMVAKTQQKLELDINVAIEYAKKLPLGSIQSINKAVIAGKKEFNNPDANAYAAAINTVRSEYARLMSGPTSNAMLPVEAMKKGNELLSSGVDVPSLMEVGAQMKRDASNTMTATRTQIDALHQSITSLGRQQAFQAGEQPAGPPSAPSTNAPRILRFDNKGNLVTQ